MIATAKTPAEHERIAQFYEAKARDYRTQEQEHEAMIAAYKANSSLSTDKNYASTIGHCEYFVQTFREMAVKSHELAQLHEQMVKDAGKKPILHPQRTQCQRVPLGRQMLAAIPAA